jgi:hypothetical protein
VDGKPLIFPYIIWESAVAGSFFLDKYDMLCYRMHFKRRPLYEVIPPLSDSDFIVQYLVRLSGTGAAGPNCRNHPAGL